MSEEQKPVETEEKEPTFDDIQAENAKYEEQQKEGLTNEQNSSNIEQEKKPEQIKEEPASQIPENWYIEGVPRSLKTLDDYHKWVVGMNNLRGKQSAEIEQVRREIAEFRGAMGARRQPEQQVDIESEWQPHLAERPVQTIAEITSRIVEAKLKEALGGIRKDYDGKLSKYDGFLQNQEIKNARAGFLEKSKLSQDDEGRISQIIQDRADRYKKEFTDENGNLDINGVLADAYERYKAAKYDEMQSGAKEETNKRAAEKTRATVAPGTGKPPMQDAEEFDKMSLEDQEKYIKSKILKF